MTLVSRRSTFAAQIRRRLPVVEILPPEAAGIDPERFANMAVNRTQISLGLTGISFNRTRLSGVSGQPVGWPGLRILRPRLTSAQTPATVAPSSTAETSTSGSHTSQSNPSQSNRSAGDPSVFGLCSRSGRSLGQRLSSDRRRSTPAGPILMGRTLLNRTLRMYNSSRSFLSALRPSASEN